MRLILEKTTGGTRRKSNRDAGRGPDLGAARRRLRGAWPAALEAAAKHVILDYGELMLFLIVAITYVNTMQERRVFSVLRARLVGMGSLPPALLAGRRTGVRLRDRSSTISPPRSSWAPWWWRWASALALHRDGLHHHRGGRQCGRASSRRSATSTSLMVWQKGKAAVPWSSSTSSSPRWVAFPVPAMLMHFSVPKGAPDAIVEVKTSTTAVRW